MPASSSLPRVRIQGRHLVDPLGRVLLLRGVSVSGLSKLPSTPDGRTHRCQPAELFDHTHVSFVGHPIPVEDAHHHFSQLVGWGYELIRLVVCWEALEHEGPGVYDTAYIDYLVQLVAICDKLGLYVIVDAHQDVWSRLCGGSGAPGWTLELVGFEPAHLAETGAAALQQLGAPKGVWPSGYQKLAAATMFTLFFAGETFAPNRTVNRGLHAAWQKEGLKDQISIQSFLQDSMIEAFGHLADQLAQFDCLVGFEPMNEPHRGFINLYSPYGWNPTTDLFLHDCPSFIESLALGDGHSQSINVYTPIWPIPSFRFHSRIVSPTVRAWKTDSECVWKEHGVWAWDDKRGKANVLRPNYFNFDPATGKPYDFYVQALYPFVQRFANRVQRSRPEALIMVGPIPNEFYRLWSINQQPANLVAAPHFYDLFSLVHKSHGNVTMDVQAICMNKPIWKWIYFGHDAAKRNYRNQISNTIKSAYENIGEIPCLVGEAGICMDLNGGEAFKTGSFYWQERQMDALITALEANLVLFVLWNYNPLNTDEHGDGWNGENFSFISSSAPKTSDGYHEPRILNSVLRPYARRVAGLPLETTFDLQSMAFEFKFESRSSQSKSETCQTEIFVPKTRFNQQNAVIEISDGTFDWDFEAQVVIWTHEPKDEGLQKNSHDPWGLNSLIWLSIVGLFFIIWLL